MATKTNTLFGLTIGLLALSPPASSTSTIDLKTCPSAYGLGSGFECANFTVPVDHDHPYNNQTIDIWVSRRRASGNSTSVGTLFFNWGGPGTSSSYIWEAIAEGYPLLSQTLQDNFDIVAIDPRGIGLSNPIACDHTLWNKAPQVFAADNESFASLVDFNKQFSGSCEKLTGPLFNFLDTVSTVKDYELVRQALDVDKINFIGFSYGSVQGQAYAELYPEHVGRFVWDGIASHDTWDISTIMTSGLAYETVLKQFFAWCNTTSDCPLENQPVEEYFTSLTNATALPAPSCNGTCQPSVTGEDVLFNAQSGLTYVSSSLGLPGWADLASGIKEAINGDASYFSNTILTDNTLTGSDATYVGRATMCQDYGSWLHSAADLKRVLDVTSRLLPLTKGANEFFTTLAYCAGWTAPVRYPAKPLDVKKMAQLPPVLLVNAFYDPGTSAAWAERVREQMPTAVNLWRNGAGHTSYLLFGETQQAMDEFLVTGTLPADGTILNS